MQRLPVLLVTILAACAGPRVEDSGASSMPQPDGPLSASSAAEVPSSVLMVGNSFTFWNEGLWGPLEDGLRAQDAEATVRPCMRGGASLEVQWGREKVQRWIRSGEHEVVVLQGDIPEASVASFEEYAGLLIALCREHGAEPVLLETWDYERLAWCSLEEIVAAHERVASEHGVRVIPVGEAWGLARARRPELDLYDRDDEHPNLRGSYLALVLTHAVLTGARGDGLLPVPEAWSALAPEDAAWLRALSDEVLRG